MEDKQMSECRQVIQHDSKQKLTEVSIISCHNLTILAWGPIYLARAVLSYLTGYDN